jgi:hypothetical protein
LKDIRSIRFCVVGTVAAGLTAGSLGYCQEILATKTSELSIAAAPSTDSPTPSSDKDTSPGPTASTDDGWHLGVAPYLWFPGAHGTVGGPNRQASFSASPGDLLANFRFGLMGLVDLRHNRLVLPIDVMWVRLADDKALPFPNIPATTANLKGAEFLLTPKVGYRMVDLQKLKIDGLVGFRYWHFGQSLQFSPSRLGLTFSGSEAWVDPLVGARMRATLSRKLEATIAGDVGGGGVTSKQDYQVAGVLGYRIKPKWVLLVGYRYLYVDYRTGGAILTCTTSGVLLGVSINLK